MQCVGWPVGGGGVPCPGCVQARMLVDVLTQGMHRDCVDAARTASSASAQSPRYQVVTTNHTTQRRNATIRPPPSLS